MKAKKKPLEVLAMADLGVDATPHNTVVHVDDPPARAAGRTVADVDELLTALKSEAVI
jgi:electron transfer flavoprotein beta subunit